jgi:hypothetical protein
MHPGVAGFVRLGPGQVFMVDEFTDPPFRRRGITRRMAGAKGIPRVGTVTRTRLLWKVWFDWSRARAEDQPRGASLRGESPTATTTRAPGAATGWTPRPYAATSSTCQPAHGVLSSS